MSGPRYIDMAPEEPAIAVDDLLYTEAGSRYLVTSVHTIAGRARSDDCEDECPPNVVRYGLKCTRLPKHTPIPADVRSIKVHWHSRGRRR